jgi:hypothetical protein
MGRGIGFELCAPQEEVGYEDEFMWTTKRVRRSQPWARSAVPGRVEPAGIGEANAANPSCASLRPS